MTEADADDKVRDFLARISTKKRAKSAPIRSSPREHAVPAPRANRCSEHYIAGPGRGHHELVKDLVPAVVRCAQEGVQDLAHDRQGGQMFDSVSKEIAAAHRQLLSLGELNPTDPAHVRVLRRVVQASSKNVTAVKRQGKSARILRRIKAEVLSVIEDCDLAVQIQVLQEFLSKLEGNPLTPNAQTMSVLSNQPWTVCTMR